MSKRIFVCLVLFHSVLLFYDANAELAGNSNQENFLYPICINDKWGYMDETGNLVIAPSFYSALDNASFSEGDALVGVADGDDIREVLINEEGKELSLPIDATPVSTGTAFQSAKRIQPVWV